MAMLSVSTLVPAPPKSPIDPPIPIPIPAGDCLLDQPAKPIPLPEDLPGSSYSLNQQCELAFGVGSKPCPYMQYCAKLWCTGKARGQIVCQTRHFPWADGTGCGDGRFCLKGSCVERHNISKYRVSTCAVSPKRTSRGGHSEVLVSVPAELPHVKRDGGPLGIKYSSRRDAAALLRQHRAEVLLAKGWLPAWSICNSFIFTGTVV